MAILLVLLLAQDPELIQTIPMPKVEGRIDHFAWDAKSGRLAVAALGNNTVEVIDVAAGKVVHRLDNFHEPQGIAAVEGKWVVASGGDGSCRVYDGESFRMVHKVDCKEDADNVRYDADAKLVYVGYGSGALGVVDPVKGARIADIRLDGHPESFQLETKGKRIYVNVPGANQIAVVDREKKAVVAKWTLSASSNFPMALDEDGRRLFVGCRNPAKLLVFDLDSGKETAAVDCSGDTDDVFYDAASKRVYVSCGAGFLDVFSIDGTPKRTAKIPTASGARTCLYIADPGRIFLAVPHRGSQQAEIRVYKTKG